MTDQPIDITQFNPVTEGKATILFPKNNEVFYNPVQEFNRDMSIAAIRTWSEIYLQEKKDRIAKKTANITDPVEKQHRVKKMEDRLNPHDFNILEALAATGLRSIRYAKEIPNLRQVVANDLLQDAVDAIRRNIQYNELDEKLVKPNRDDAMRVMYKTVGTDDRYDVVDLDPYGSAAPFVDGAVQAVAEGGLLCVTCTDLAVLAGSMHPETCYGKYAGMPLKGMFPHEMAVRLVLQMLQTSAGRYKRYIVPMVSLSIDFYLRVFVRVYTSPDQVKKAASKIGVMYECSGCHAFAPQPFGKIDLKPNGQEHHTVNSGPPVNSRCDHCANTHHIGGPTWLGSLHNQDFLQKMFSHVEANQDKYGTSERMKGMLSLAKEELDQPGYWTLQRLCGTLHCNTVPMKDLFSAFLNGGYQVSLSHCGPTTIKTNAPSEVVWDIMRCWIQANPVTMKNLGENSPARRLLEKEPKFKADFTRHPDAVGESHKFVRYQINPTAHWGPKARAGKKRKSDTEQ
ncbi:N2,N2-dimethylguanosine tRNA methyltransferase [Hesseltinella vesiculosa]|uniref:tRNA (guanine(26)-N(2))-dimethyltransferase n=1 Tax=Hesseltinella vesiculosa TaxID=101127 RepID=A0A1X2G886_9FUNG|nr:N2,N2-dimethylguanosine tRNA methyltransferase [Hesseltinella vesiculosa]